jgi:hypothetical protein
MIYSRLLIALVFVMCTACGSDEDAASDNWWEEDGGGTAADTSSGSGTTSTGDKPADSGDKPEDDGEKDGYTGKIDTSAGTGTFNYNKTQTSGENCDLSYPVLSATALETCDACSFAWALELGEVSITTDTGGCGDFASYSNTTRYYGHGSALLAEYGGISYYELYESDEGTSWMNNGGFSWTTDASWDFGSK